ncbi:IclR family transcriptional regulator [Cupriavidus agavae]|uniref:IclR family transcriptional regulator n=1 Tax=Cupriavidus agavae TaxID=1001822 RepID=A0A4Q7S9N5_9BURK|nr:IclR family transcriptional regulator [Cupriavidus agavae]RZT43196.1 IclR family transcriptional regulator [Cupriavidus agavae]
MNGPDDSKPQRGIQSLDNTGQLLDALADAGRPLSLGELARAAGMAPAKAFPHLVSLQKIGLLSRNADGDFEAGTLALDLGLMALQRLSPTREAEPEVIGLAHATGLSVAMAVLGPLGPTIIRLEESPRPQHVSLRVGTVLSMVNTAIGRTFAAHLPDETRRQALDDDAIRMAGAATGAPPDLAARWQAIRDAGLEQALSHPIPGIDTLAAPVFDHTGTLALVIAAMGSSGSFDSGLNGDVATLVKQAAGRLSWRFGAVGGDTYTGN